MFRSLTLVNFKNFRDVTVAFGPVTVLVGANASGKSNLRDAFRFLHGVARGYTLAEVIGEKWVEGGVLQWRGIRGGLSEAAFAGESRFTVSCQFDARIPFRVKTIPVNAREKPKIRDLHVLKSFDFSLEIELGDSLDEPRLVRESLYDDEHKLIYDTHPPSDPPKQPKGKRIAARVSRGSRARGRSSRMEFQSNQPILTQLTDHDELNPSVRRQVGGVTASLQSMQFLDLSPQAMRLPSLPGQDILGDRGENLSSVLFAICQDEQRKSAVLEWIRQLTPIDVADFDFVPDATGRILVSLKEHDGSLTSAHSASDGTLRFLAAIAALYGPSPAKLYFLEEIDNGIHPTRLALLVDLLESQAKSHTTQVVTTTHSPQLLGFLSQASLANAALVYRLEGERASHVTKIIDIPSAREVLQKHNLGRLQESGWLENAVEFASAEAGA